MLVGVQVSLLARVDVRVVKGRRTVNPFGYAYVGSNPTLPTLL